MVQVLRNSGLWFENSFTNKEEDLKITPPEVKIEPLGIVKWVRRLTPDT